MQTVQTERVPSTTTLPRILYVTGKGGVGKTLVAAGIATAAARMEGRAIYVEFSDGKSGRRAQVDRQQGVEHIVLDLRGAVTEAAQQLFGSARLAKLALNNFAMRPLIHAAPALRELGVLELARQIVEAHPGQQVVFDMPASGHCVSWLRTPALVRRLSAQGPLHALCARLEDQVVSRPHASVVVVTLPERLVLSETRSLCQMIEEDVGLPVERIIVNRVPEAPPTRAVADAAALSRLAAGPQRDAAKRLAEHLARRLTARNEALAALREATAASQSVGASSREPLLLPLSVEEPGAGTMADWLTERSFV